MKNTYQKVMLKICSYTLIFSLVMNLGIFSAFSVAAPKPSVKKITVTNAKGNKLTLFKGQSCKLKVNVSVKPNKVTYKKVKFSSKNRRIATVSSTGKVKAISNGKTKITVTSKTNTKKVLNITVNVKAVKITSLTLNNSTLELSSENDDYRLKATIRPSNATIKKLKWTTSDAEVADVDEDGFVTPYSSGTAIIKVTATDGSKKSATCKVTVYEEDDSDEEDSDEDEDDSEDEEDDTLEEE